MAQTSQQKCLWQALRSDLIVDMTHSEQMDQVIERFMDLEGRKDRQ